MSVIRLCGLVVGLGAGLVLARTGQLWGVAPAIAVAVLVAVLISELGRPRPERQQGVSAALEVRRVRDYVRPAAAVGGVVLGIVLLAEMTYLSTLDNHGFSRPVVGISLSQGYLTGDPYLQPQVVEISGGDTYVALDCAQAPQSFDVGGWVLGCDIGSAAPRVDVLPGLLATIATALLVLLIGAAVVWLTVRSPRAGADSPTRERDERWRRGVVDTVLGVVGVITATLVVVWNMALVLTVPTFRWSDVLAVVLAAVGFGAVAYYGSSLLRSPTR